jgi:hypothetical protein
MRRITVITLFYFLVISVSLAQSPYKNVKISEDNSPNELSVVINPNNINHIVLASNIDSYFVSFDGGESWSSRKQESKFGVWGDPCLVFDTKENLYYFHLSLTNGYSNDKIICQKSINGGISWGALDTCIGSNPPHLQDKEWASVDNTNSPFRDKIYLTWTQCGQGTYAKTNEDGTHTPEIPKQTDIFFSSSSDEGVSWTKPGIISHTPGSSCSDVPNTLLGVTSAIGPNGELYVCWASGKGIIFNSSTNGGASWLESDVTVDSLPKGFKYSVPGIYRCFGFPSITCDRTYGKDQGKIYISWSDQRNGPEDTDVWLTYSDDGGRTWIKSKRVNDDAPGTNQFGSWLTLDQTTGFLYFIYYDRRNYTTEMTDVYIAKSTDGGLTFLNERISESPFTPDENTFFGDYINIAAANGVVRPVWTRLDHSALSIWTAIINEN